MDYFVKNLVMSIFFRIFVLSFEFTRTQTLIIK